MDDHDEIRGQTAKLAALDIPRNAGAGQRAKLQEAVGEAFVGGFRLVMALGGALALLSAVCAWLTLDGRSGNNRSGPVDPASRRSTKG